MQKVFCWHSAGPPSVSCDATVAAPPVPDAVLLLLLLLHATATTAMASRPAAACLRGFENSRIGGLLCGLGGRTGPAVLTEWCGDDCMLQDGEGGLCDEGEGDHEERPADDLDAVVDLQPRRDELAQPTGRNLCGERSGRDDIERRRAHSGHD